MATLALTTLSAASTLCDEEDMLFELALMALKARSTLEEEFERLRLDT